MMVLFSHVFLIRCQQFSAFHRISYVSRMCAHDISICSREALKSIFWESVVLCRQLIAVCYILVSGKHLIETFGSVYGSCVSYRWYVADSRNSVVLSVLVRRWCGSQVTKTGSAGTWRFEWFHVPTVSVLSIEQSVLVYFINYGTHGGSEKHSEEEARGKE